jgi:hypothetical protein
MRKSVLPLLVLTAGLGATEVPAQNLRMSEPPAASASVAAPSRGMSMADVERKFGAPSAKVAPVGQPPISRWAYPGFVVFFEYDHVVHAVSRSPGTAG